MEMFCIGCMCSEDVCNCEEDLLVEAYFCDNCGTIGSEEDIDRHSGLCEGFEERLQLNEV